MNKTFVDLVEATANFQYQSDQAMESIDNFILKVQSIDSIDEKDKDCFIEILNNLRPAIIERLVRKTTYYKYL